MSEHQIFRYIYFNILHRVRLDSLIYYIYIYLCIYNFNILINQIHSLKTNIVYIIAKYCRHRSKGFQFIPNKPKKKTYFVVYSLLNPMCIIYRVSYLFTRPLIGSRLYLFIGSHSYTVGFLGRGGDCYDFRMYVC